MLTCLSDQTYPGRPAMDLKDSYSLYETRDVTVALFKTLYVPLNVHDGCQMSVDIGLFIQTS